MRIETGNIRRLTSRYSGSSRVFNAEVGHCADNHDRLHASIAQTFGQIRIFKGAVLTFDDSLVFAYQCSAKHAI